jgi:hypothetical protein
MNSNSGTDGMTRRNRGYALARPVDKVLINVSAVDTGLVPRLSFRGQLMQRSPTVSTSRSLSTCTDQP